MDGLRVGRGRRPIRRLRVCTRPRGDHGGHAPRAGAAPERTRARALAKAASRFGSASLIRQLGSVAEGIVVARHGGLELVAGTDAELAEDLVEVVLDRARTDEQPGADVVVREAVTSEPRDLSL